jgi:hypothetical protein
MDRSRDRRKKARSSPTGPEKFWERMPERQVRYDSIPDFVQVRKAEVRLKKKQLNAPGPRSSADF